MALPLPPPVLLPLLLLPSLNDPGQAVSPLFQHLIIGLGNPGDKYAKTRHNVGFMVADLLAQRLDLSWRNHCKALVGESRRAGGLVVAKPQTFMNLSGQSVASLLSWYKISPQDTLLVYDDMDLPAGALRVRLQGGSAGHNGMASVIELLGTEEIPRIRIGVGRPNRGAEVGHVLGGIQGDEGLLVARAVETAAEAVLFWAEKGTQLTMNRFNLKEPKASEPVVAPDSPKKPEA
jgi:PTH1 family peptidyl-tRNA hydrolase